MFINLFPLMLHAVCSYICGRNHSFDPITHSFWPNTVNTHKNVRFPVLFGNFIFFFGGIMFWMILVLFHIDLISRAALKRGRIGFIISDFNKKHNAEMHGFNALQNSSFWVQIFGMIICFRCRFRNVRRGLTNITGINFVKLKPILSMDNEAKKHDANGEHEEDKIKAILEEGDAVDIVYGPRFIKGCFACNDDGEKEGSDSNGSVCKSLFKAICLLSLLYMFLPFWLLMICVLLVSLPGSVLINVIQAICGCDCRIHSTYNISSVFVGLFCGFICGFGLFVRMLQCMVNGIGMRNVTCGIIQCLYMFDRFLKGLLCLCSIEFFLISSSTPVTLVNY
eukprot:606581_1